MTLEQPIWLLLLIPLAAALWRWRAPTRLIEALRIIAVVLVVVAMARPLIWLPTRSGVVVVVADRSRSMPGTSAAEQQEVISLLLESKSPRDRLAVVSFGETATVERPADVGSFSGFIHDVGPDGSNLADALARAIALTDQQTPSRLLVLSDGAWTGRDPAEEAGRAAARGLAIDFRHMARPSAGDVAIDAFEAPLTAQPGESFMLHAWLRSALAQPVDYELHRGQTLIASGTSDLNAGLSRLTFRDRSADPGTASYSLTIRPAGQDPVPENNTAKALVGIEGPRPLLVITPTGDSGLVNLLAAGGLTVHQTTGEAHDWSLESLSGYAGVILENAPAQRLGQSGMETLAAWVESSGGGLWMTGGRQSFGPGGYFKSPLEPILPVSMELRREHRKLSVAIVVALDRSGSMAVPVSGGQLKMDLANIGTAQVLDLLSSMDEFGVLAVDSSSHVIADLQQVPENKGPLRGQILRIESMGGGIFVYEALSNAAEMLADAQSHTRHIILFSDAADSEEPGRYRELLEHAAAANITVSVIGLGTPGDVDAALLEDIAHRGNGRIFFTTDANQLPQLFAQDTFVVARSSFVDVPTPIDTTAGLTAITGRAFPDPPPLGGYNLTYLREGATLAAVTQDEYTAPVVATWQAGLGRVAAYTGEADGEFAGPIAQWNHAGELFTSLGRWTAGDTGNLPDGMMLTQNVDRGLYTVRLHLDPQRASELIQTIPRVVTLRGKPGEPPQREEAPMQWETPDTLRLTLPLRGDEVALATVDIPGQSPQSLAPVTLPYSPEFRPADTTAAQQTFVRLASATAGQERLELGSIWRDLPRIPQRILLAPALVIAAILILLLEVLERRTGALAMLGQRIRQPRKAAAARTPSPAAEAPSPRPRPASTKKQKNVPATTPAAPEPAPPKPAAEPDAAPTMLDALQRATARANSRTRRKDQ